MILIVYLDLLDNSFIKYNYKEPQPFIKIFAKNIIEWIIENLDINYFQNVLLIYNDNNYKYIIQNIFKNHIYYHKFSFVFYNIKSNIIQSILNNIENINDNESILYIDTKKLYLDNLSLLIKDKNTIFYVNEDIKNDKNIYISINNDNKIINNILTSNSINKYISVGSFGFNSLTQFKEYYTKLIEINNDFQNLNIINLINLMIMDNIIFYGYELNHENINNLSTPFHIRLFCNNYPKINAINNNVMIHSKKFSFHLEDTLLIKDNHSYIPNIKNIEFLKYLKKFGNIIIIESTIESNDNESVNNIKKILIDLDIIYDEIKFDKSKVDYSISLNNIILNDNLEKTLGFYNDKIEARDFNQIIEKDYKIFKKNGNDLSGEIYYYNNIPKDIKDIFPVMFNHSLDYKSYDMEKIYGVSISYLFLNEELTLEEFDNILNTINRIHNCEIKNDDKNINIYNNYCKKIKYRYNNYNYKQFNNSTKIYNFLIEKLSEYEDKKIGKTTIIHGDVVFTNILINKFGKIKLIDPRGKIDNMNTIYGDKFYDYAKIYQSLLGYDEILLNKKISDTYKNKFLEYFSKKIIEKFGTEIFYYLKIICASLLFTLIPLHNNEKCIYYFNLIDKLNLFL
jgi:hypothetical protein